MKYMLVLVMIFSSLGDPVVSICGVLLMIGFFELDRKLEKLISCSEPENYRKNIQDYMAQEHDLMFLESECDDLFGHIFEDFMVD